MGAQRLPSVAVFNKIDNDIFGKQTGDKRAPGPFVDPGASPTRRVDPRVTTVTKK